MTEVSSTSGEDQGRAGARRAASEQVNWISAIPFLAVHAAVLLVVVTGVSARALVLLAVTFFARQFLITGGYHRYFAHRTYRLGRTQQFLVAFAGTTAVQKGPLWWAAHHRRHHRFADTDGDLHSPSRGFWWSHVGWILCDRYCETDLDGIGDFARFPELRFVDRHDWIGPWLLALLCLAIAGWQGLIVGFFLSTVLLWHTTFMINSVAHVVGRRPYRTGDTSGNSALLAVLTLGEGWHNNHHHHPASARLGFRWWQWDPTYYVLRTLAWVRFASGLKVYAPARRASLPETGRTARSRADGVESTARAAHPAGRGGEVPTRGGECAAPAIVRSAVQPHLDEQASTAPQGGTQVGRSPRSP